MVEECNSDRQKLGSRIPSISCETNKGTRAGGSGDLADKFRIPSQSTDGNKGDGTDAFQPEDQRMQMKGSGVRERLKRHREEVAGKVTIPEKWGKEELLKDWIDYSAFDRILAAGRIASARESLIAEGRRASSRPPRVESRC